MKYYENNTILYFESGFSLVCTLLLMFCQADMRKQFRALFVETVAGIFIVI